MRERLARVGRDRTRSVDARTLILSGVLIVTALTYLRSLGNGFVFDDGSLVVANRYIGQWSFLWKSLIHDEYWFKNPAHLPQTARYRPLLLIWYGLNYHLFGLHPAGWHATMVAVHLIAVWLAYKVAARLTGAWQSGLLAALLFGVAPLNVSGVGWIAGFGLVLSAVFELGAFYLVAKDEAPGLGSWAVALGLYGGALLSHESAVAFPGLIIAYFLLYQSPDLSGSPGSARRRAGMALATASPFVLEVLLYLAARRLVLGFTLNAPDALVWVSGWPALLSIPRVFATYLLILALPWLAGLVHAEHIARSIGSPSFYVPTVALAVAAVIVMWGARESAQRRLYLLCAAWMVIAVSPMLNLAALRKDMFVQDSYFYLSSLGWWVMVADWLRRMARAGVRLKLPAAVAAIALIMVNVVSLWRVQRFFHDDVAFFRRAIEVAPDSETWHSLLGVVLKQHGDLVGAEHELKAAARLAPWDATALYDLGFVDAQLGRFGEAAAEMRQGLSRIPYAPAYAYVTLAKVSDAAGDAAGAEAALKHLESMPQGSELADLTRVQLKMKHGDAAGAEAIARELSKNYPADPRVWQQLGAILAAQQHNEEALVAYQRALALVPDDVQTRFLAARALHAVGRDREALEQCRIVQAAAPDDANVRKLMAEIGQSLERRH